MKISWKLFFKFWSSKFLTSSCFWQVYQNKNCIFHISTAKSPNDLWCCQIVSMKENCRDFNILPLVIFVFHRPVLSLIHNGSVLYVQIGLTLSGSSKWKIVIFNISLNIVTLVPVISKFCHVTKNLIFTLNL